MKINYFKKLATGLLLFGATLTNAQVVNFEVMTDVSGDTIQLDSNGVWLADTVGFGIKSGNATFYCNYAYSPNWGGYYYWDNGFSLTNNINDSTTGFTNNYSTYAGSAYSDSTFSTVNCEHSAGNYNPATVELESSDVIKGFYISNTTYAALSMKNGDSFAKKFGDSTDVNGDYDGTNGQDWFKVTMLPIEGNAVNLSKAVDYYLADYRFLDDTLDYILEGWNWVDLSFWGEVDGMEIVLSSSDIGSYGMNTPAYFSMDDFTLGAMTSINDFDEKLISVYPNPANDILNFRIPSANFEIKMYNAFGQQVISSEKNRIDISGLEGGAYFIKITIDEKVITRKVIKN